MSGGRPDPGRPPLKAGERQADTEKVPISASRAALRIVTFAIADTIYLYRVASDSCSAGTPLDALWALSRRQARTDE